MSINPNEIYPNNKRLHNGRIDFSKVSGSLELPNLVEIQTDSYKWFLEHGIDEVFKEVFPIANFSESRFFDYIDCQLDEPKYTYLQCKERGYTYCAPLHVRLRYRPAEGQGEMALFNNVFMGDIPLMTESGTFIVNGAERVIVSQIVRSPGAYLSKEFIGKTGFLTYNADLIPTRGTWLELEVEQKEKEKQSIINVRIDRQKKMPATILLKALGLTY